MLNNKNKIQKIILTSLFASLSYIAFTYLKIPVPTPVGLVVPIHVGNAFCVLAAFILGGFYGGIAGSLGMTIADLLDPVYITYAPKTFILKLCIGLITGFFAHRVAKINESTNNKYIFKWLIISSAISLAFNVIFDPIFSFLYKKYILAVPVDIAKVLATFTAGVSMINAFVSIIVAVLIYMSLRKILKRINLI